MRGIRQGLEAVSQFAEAARAVEAGDQHRTAACDFDREGSAAVRSAQLEADDPVEADRATPLVRVGASRRIRAAPHAPAEKPQRGSAGRLWMSPCWGLTPSRTRRARSRLRK